MTVSDMFHGGSLWLLLVCVLLVVGVVIGLFTRRGSGIDVHPYAKTSDADELTE